MYTSTHILTKVFQMFVVLASDTSLVAEKLLPVSTICSTGSLSKYYKSIVMLLLKPASSGKLTEKEIGPREEL